MAKGKTRTVARIHSEQYAFRLFLNREKNHFRVGRKISLFMGLVREMSLC